MAGAPSGKISQGAKVEQSRKRAYSFLTKSELDTLEKAARKKRWGKRDWLAIRMAYRHGLRASELVGLEWNDFDLDRGTVLIQRAKGGISSTPSSGWRRTTSLEGNQARSGSWCSSRLSLRTRRAMGLRELFPDGGKTW